jgi:dTDP-L-rhamnose 4-epimerase
VSPQRLLITGGAGFIGSFLTDHFLRGGAAVRILDSLDPQVHPSGPPSYLAPDAELRVGDVRDRAALEAALDGVDVVIHCAAAVGVAQSLYRVQHYVDANVGGTATLLELLATRKPRIAKLLIFTSMTGYGEGVYRRPSDGSLLRVAIRTQEDIDRHGWEPVDPQSGERLVAAPTPEDSTLLARNVYALTKRYQEELALSLGDVYGFPVVCLRLFNVYGPRQSLSNPYTGVLAIFLSRLLQGRPPVVYEDGLQSRDFVSVHDVVRAAALAIDSPAAAGCVMNVGTGIPRPIAEVARTLARLVGRPEIEPSVSGEFRRGDVRHCIADTTRVRERLGFEPSVRWEDGLAEVVAWSRDAETVDGFDRADEELRAHGLVR